MIPIISLFLIIVLVYFLIRRHNKARWIMPSDPFPADWRIILTTHVAFYNALSEEEKTWFEYKVQEFLLNCRITGIKTEVDITDELLVASSAVIPVFEFKNWRYSNIYEVLLYPAMFNEKFEIEGKDRFIAGMVGTGYMDGKMILSKSALIHGFQNETDKKNTAIHEFVHLIDGADGNIDGVPSLLLEKQYTIPWIDLMNKKIDEIFEEKSDINPYGGVNRAEFFSVASEYFFERPKLLAEKHPKLYDLLEQIFNQDMVSKSLKKKKVKIGRNSPCPCSSGLKFKKCCGQKHYKK
ncbi:MAG: zinc-dependent peptidase [Bacteroidales bacterium]|nr:zinc-dependent peptidase [Bacteroidales bacterium]